MFIDIAAGKTATENLQGANFYYKGGTSTISVKAVIQGGNRNYYLEPGMGFKLKGGERFSSVEIYSASAQTIEFEISDDDVYDNRSVLSLSGSLPVNVTGGTVGVTGNIATTRALSPANGVPYNATTATQILAGGDTNRMKTGIVFSTDVFIGYDNTVDNTKGFPWGAGVMFGDENQGALWVYSMSAGNAKFLQDRK